MITIRLTVSRTPIMSDNFPGRVKGERVTGNGFIDKVKAVRELTRWDVQSAMDAVSAGEFYFEEVQKGIS